MVGQEALSSGQIATATLHLLSRGIARTAGLLQTTTMGSLHTAIAAEAELQTHV